MHALLNSALDLNGQLHFAATIGHVKNTLHSKDRNVWPRVGLGTVWERKFCAPSDMLVAQLVAQA